MVHTAWSSSSVRYTWTDARIEGQTSWNYGVEKHECSIPTYGGKNNRSL